MQSNDRSKKHSAFAKMVLDNIDDRVIDPLKRHNDTVELLNRQHNENIRHHKETASKVVTEENKPKFNDYEMLDNHRLNNRRI